MPSFERAINLVNCGKAFFGTELPITMFVIILNALGASCCSFPGVFPWEMPQAVAACGVLSSFSSRKPHFSRGLLSFVFRCLLYFFFLFHLACMWVFILQKGETHSVSEESMTIFIHNHQRVYITRSFKESFQLLSCSKLLTCPALFGKVKGTH